MADLSLFWNGFGIGLSIAAPVGPIGVLCIQRTLNHGRAIGLASGIGAATADGLFGLMAALGLTVVSKFLTDQQTWLRLIGGAYLLYLGIKTFRSRPAEKAAVVEDKRGLVSAYTSTLFLTATNPLTIFSFIAIFAGVGAGSTNSDTPSPLLVVLGVFLGSCAWWLFLVTITGIFRSRMNTQSMQWINRGSGLIIVTFAIVILIGLLAR
jgi:threonine/homoserine/homoserine lactone efflux protein